MDRNLFYSSLRNSADVFGSSLSQSEVDGCEAILDECLFRRVSLEQAAYILATAYGETGGAMQPRRENMNYSAKRIPQVFSASRRRGVPVYKLAGDPVLLANTVYATTLGNRAGTNDGWRFRGAGLGQITGRDNYKKWGDKLGLDLVGNPELLMDLDVSVRALVMPMIEGWATGKRLSDYIDDGVADYVSARRVWNGTFDAHKYARFAQSFEVALRLSGYTLDEPKKVKPRPKFSDLLSLILSFFRGAK